jgi:hypothetical protein
MLFSTKIGCTGSSESQNAWNGAEQQNREKQRSKEVAGILNAKAGSLEDPAQLRERITSAVRRGIIF